MSLIICGAALPPGQHGEPAILVEKDTLCADCGDCHDVEKCPRCGSWIHLGFGLMGGGFGDYKFCDNSECKWMWKNVWPEDAE